MHSSRKMLHAILQTTIHPNELCKFNIMVRSAVPNRYSHQRGNQTVTVSAGLVSKAQKNFQRNVTGQSSYVSQKYLHKESLANQVPIPEYIEVDPEEGLQGIGGDGPLEGVFSGLESDFPCLRDNSIEGPEPDYDFVVSGYNIYHHKKPFTLKYRNGILPELKIAYETWGTLNEKKDNAVLLFGGLSASSHAKSHDDNRNKGWWESFVGPGSALDTEKYFVICANHLGGCYGSSGPSSINPVTEKPYGTTFPLLSIDDMVECQFLLLDSLGIDKVHASVGSSLGGMCSVKSACLYPQRVGKVVSISACHSSHPSSIGMRYLQRKAIMIDPHWQKGHYYGSGHYPKAGMKMAREIATITYRSGPEWEQRFGRKHVDEEPSLCPFFEIENYINHQGESFSTKLDPNTLIYISKAMDLFDIRAGYDSLKDALSRVSCPVMIIGVKSDILFPVTQQRSLAEQLKLAGNGTVTYYELESLYGHDTFLLDLNGVGTGVKGFVETLMTQKGKA